MTGRSSAILRLLAGEARRNLASLRPITLAQAGFLALIGVAVVGFDYQSVSVLVDEHVAYARAGGYVYVVRGSVDPSSCRDLGTASSVRFVGAAVYASPILIESQPKRPLPVIEVAGETTSIWAADAIPTSSWAIGSVLGQDLSTSALERLSITPKLTAEIDVAIDSDRQPLTARALVAPRPWVGDFDECWIEFVPIPPDLAASIARMVSAGSDPDIRVLATRSPGAVAPEVAFDRRVTQWGWLAGALLTTGLLVITELARRGDTALYLIVGWQRGEVTLQRLLEFVAVQLPSRLLVAGIAVGAAIMLDNASGFELSVALNNVMLLTGAEILGATLVMAATIPRELVATLRGQ